MNLSTAANLAEIIGAVIVIGGLAFGVIQLQQFRLQRRSQAALEVARSFQDAEFSRALRLVLSMPRDLSADEVRELGPRLENHRIFPNRCNIQFAVPTGKQALFIRIWERGVGETAASGTSACAVACAAVRRGIVKSPVTVRAPGGALLVRVGASGGDPFDVTLEGPVAEVMRGRFSRSFVRELVRRRPARSGVGRTARTSA